MAGKGVKISENRMHPSTPSEATETHHRQVVVLLHIVEASSRSNRLTGFERLQGYFQAHIGCFGFLPKGGRVLDGPIGCHVPTGLSHHPDWCLCRQLASGDPK